MVRRSRRRSLAQPAALLLFGCLASGGHPAPVAAQRSAAEPTPHPYQPGIDVLDYDLTLDLPDAGRAIQGRAVLAVRRSPTPGGPRPDSLVLDLVGMRVDSVLVDGRPVGFGRDDRTVRVPIGAAARDSFSVAVRYGGEPSDGLIIGTDDRSRWMAFGDNWPNRARFWIPSVDHPSDKATVSWTVRAPAGRRVIANGLPVGAPPSDGGRATVRWRESRPVPVYTMVIAAAPLAEVALGQAACGHSEFTGCVAQSAYASPESRDFFPGPFAEANGIVDFFSAIVAPFPYEKLAHLQSSTRFGGMENASAIFYNDAAIRNGSLDIRTVAHETAHQWFGDAVTPREWPHVWLSEGFATYFAELWIERSRGDSAFRDGMRALRTKVLSSPVTGERPVIDTDQSNLLALLNTNSYEKGAWVLHMLRATVGDSTFFRGVRAYYDHHRHGTAVTDELRLEMERASGRELGWFFDQWLRRPGVVDAEAAWRYDAARGRLTLDVTQRTGAAPYRFPLVVEVVGADGRAQRATVEVPAQRRATLEVPLSLGAAPRRLVLDPGVQLLGSVRVVRQ